MIRGGWFLSTPRPTPLSSGTRWGGDSVIGRNSSEEDVSLGKEGKMMDLLDDVFDKKRKYTIDRIGSMTY